MLCQETRKRLFSAPGDAGHLRTQKRSFGFLIPHFFASHKIPLPESFSFLLRSEPCRSFFPPRVVFCAAFFCQSAGSRSA